MTLLNLYDDEANRGEKVALKFRWILVALVFSLIVVVLINGDYKEALVSTVLALIFGTYNLLLIYLFRRGTVYHAVRYISVSLDVGLLSVHIYSLSVFISPFAVATTATILLYPVLMFLSVLRYDKRLIIYTIVFTLFSFNLVYFLQYPQLDRAILNQVISSDPSGQIYKSVYLLLFGILLLYIPDLVGRMVKRNIQIAQEKNLSEMRLTLEMKDNQYIEEKLQYATLVNEQLNEKNEQIALQNEKLKEMNATKDRLFSIIGHDLKNPFTVLISLSQMIKDQLEHLDTEDLKKSLIVINNASNQGFALLDNLLDWARTQTGEIKFTPVQFPLNESVTEVLNHIGPQSEKKQVHIKSTIKNTDLVTADRNMLQTILRNLISNAVKFSSSGGEVMLEAALDQMDDKMVISISDHGVGIPQENLSKLFDIKTHQSTKGTLQESGTGLGLLICKEFIEKHGGNIHVTSSIGEGTRITFDLPILGR
jgi:signal transduction histidine kinase